jgi:hypothetical protein
VTVAHVQAGSNETVLGLLDALMDFATYIPDFLRPVMPLLTETLLGISTLRTDEEIEKIALEILLILCEERAQMVRKFPDLFNNILPILLKVCRSLLVLLRHPESYFWYNVADVHGARG